MITALSNFCKNNITSKYKIDADKIEVVYIGVDEKFKPVDFDNRQKIKKQYSQSNEYFLVWYDPHNKENLFDILKAFSIFKKWQKSSMQLLIVTKSALKPVVLQRLHLFMYTQDVKIIKHPHDFPKITASAYAVIDFSYYESFGIHSLQAMKYGVPVITCNEGAMLEICGDAALYVSPNKHSDLAEKMMMIFKDEKLRSELIEKGSKTAQKYSLEKTTALFFESILKATD